MYVTVTLSTALNLVHQNSFPKLGNFPSYFTLSQLCNFPGGATFKKQLQIPKKESKQSEITCEQSEPDRTISKIQKRRECVRALCYEPCSKNFIERLYIVKGLLVLVEKNFFFERISMRVSMQWRGPLVFEVLLCFIDPRVR